MRFKNAVKVGIQVVGVTVKDACTHMSQVKSNLPTQITCSPDYNRKRVLLFVRDISLCWKTALARDQKCLRIRHVSEVACWDLRVLIRLRGLQMVLHSIMENLM